MTDSVDGKPDNMSESTMQSHHDAAVEVASTPELLENILCFLSSTDLLLRCKLATHGFKQVINESPTLRRRMFIESGSLTGPAEPLETFPYRLVADRTWEGRHLPDLWAGVANHGPGTYFATIHGPTIGGTRKYPTLGALKILQRPGTAVEVEIFCDCMQGLDAEKAVLAADASMGDFANVVERAHVRVPKPLFEWEVEAADEYHDHNILVRAALVQQTT